MRTAAETKKGVMLTSSITFQILDRYGALVPYRQRMRAHEMSSRMSSLKTRVYSAMSTITR